MICRATVCVELGKVQEALPLYREALRLFELAELPSLESLREEIEYWSRIQSATRKEEMQAELEVRDDDTNASVQSSSGDVISSVTEASVAAIYADEKTVVSKDCSPEESSLALVSVPGSPQSQRTPRKFNVLSPGTLVRRRTPSECSFDDSISEFSHESGTISRHSNTVEELSSPSRSVMSAISDSMSVTASKGPVAGNSVTVAGGAIPAAAVPVTTLKDKISERSSRVEGTIVNTKYNNNTSHNGTNDNVITPPRRRRSKSSVATTDKQESILPNTEKARMRQFNTSATASGAAATATGRRRPAPSMLAATNAAALADIKHYKKSRSIIETTALVSKSTAVGTYLAPTPPKPVAPKAPALTAALDPVETSSFSGGSIVVPAAVLVAPTRQPPRVIRSSDSTAHRIHSGSALAPATSPISLRNPPLVAPPVTTQPASEFIQSLQQLTGAAFEGGSVDAFKENSTSLGNVQALPGVMQRAIQRQKQSAPVATAPTPTTSHTSSFTQLLPQMKQALIGDAHGSACSDDDDAEMIERQLAELQVTYERNKSRGVISSSSAGAAGSFVPVQMHHPALNGSKAKF